MIKPIIIKFDDEREYTLEFNRETVVYAEKHGFDRSDVGQKMMTRIPELFYYAFKMHHPTIKKETTDAILFEDLGGLSEALSDRLIDLFNEPYNALLSESEKPKNPKVTVLI